MSQVKYSHSRKTGSSSNILYLNDVSNFLMSKFINFSIHLTSTFTLMEIQTKELIIAYRVSIVAKNVVFDLVFVHVMANLIIMFIKFKKHFFKIFTPSYWNFFIYFIFFSNHCQFHIPFYQTRNPMFFTYAYIHIS